MADNIFSRHLHSLPLGRTEIPNFYSSLWKVLLLLQLASFIVFFDALIFPSISNKPPLIS